MLIVSTVGSNSQKDSKEENKICMALKASLESSGVTASDDEHVEAIPEGNHMSGNNIRLFLWKVVLR